MSAAVTLVGRLGADPELRFTPQGKAVASFSVVTSGRKKDGDIWVDTDVTWWRCNVWEQQAENLAESLGKGALVIVTGKVIERSSDNKDGTRHTMLEVRVEHVGPSLKTGPLTQRKAERESATADPWLTHPNGDSSPF